MNALYMRRKVKEEKIEVRCGGAKIVWEKKIGRFFSEVCSAKRRLRRTGDDGLADGARDDTKVRMKMKQLQHNRSEDENGYK